MPGIHPEAFDISEISLIRVPVALNKIKPCSHFDYSTHGASVSCQRPAMSNRWQKTPGSWAAPLSSAAGAAPVLGRECRGGAGCGGCGPPVSLAFWRWAVAFFMLLPFTLGHVKRDWKTAVQSWKWMLILSFLGISCFNAILYTAAHTTTAINVSLMQTAMPALIILISWVVFRERISSIQMVGVAVSMVGSVSHCDSWPMADFDDHGTGQRGCSDADRRVHLCPLFGAVQKTSAHPPPEYADTDLSAWAR
jgi:uncharacterized membrane protein